MTDKLIFDFKIDKDNRTITVKRTFNARLQRVWAAWTERDQLDQWWAPKPYEARTKAMYFKEGGHWLYAMIGPDGKEQWCRADYISIETMKSFSWRDAFCDEAGNIVHDLPRSIWTNNFSQQGEDSTLVLNLIQFEDLEQLEKYEEMGFQEGYTMGLNNLDEFLKDN